MEASENNNGAEGNNNKEESSYNEAVKIFVESNDADQVMPPLVLPSSLSEQFSFTGDMRLVPQQVTSSSSNSSEIERHSLNNTASSNSHTGMVRCRLYTAWY